MTIRALRDDYHGEFKDSLEKFGGAQLVYLGWDKHQMFCSSRAFPLPPEMRFQELLDNVMPEAFGQHPEFTPGAAHNAPSSAGDRLSDLPG